jgi:hypothetical protein
MALKEPNSAGATPPPPKLPIGSWSGTPLSPTTEGQLDKIFPSNRSESWANDNSDSGNIGIGSIPSGNLPVPSGTLFLTCFPGSEEALPGVHQLRHIFGMNGGFPPPAQRLFRSEARIVKPSLVEKFGVSICSTSPCQCGDRVDYVLKLVC